MANELMFNWQDSLLPVGLLQPPGSRDVEEPSYTPVRDLRTRRNARSITGQVNSIFAKVSHVFESLGEMRHAVICDADWHIQRLETQPQRLQLADGRTYTPDAKIWHRSSARPIFREIKPYKWLKDDPELDGKIQLISNASDEMGCDFEIISDAWYNKQPRLQNSNWIRRATKLAPRTHVYRIAELLTEFEALPASEIDHKSGLGRDGRFAAYALAGLRFCRVDLNEPFDDETVFFRAQV